MRNHLLFILTVLIALTSQAEAQDMSSSNSRSSALSADAFQCRRGRNDYFERALHNLTAIDTRRNPEKRTLPVALMQLKPLKNPHINPLCIESALAQVSGGRHADYTFQYCSGKKVYVKSEEPCASDNYLKMVHHSFELVSTCLKDFVADTSDPRIQNDWVETYFTLITKESGLHANVISPSGALAGAQLTSIYIKDFLEFSRDRVSAHLQKSNSSYCRGLADFALSDARVKGVSSKCNLIDIENGPLTGFLVGFGHLRRIREQILTELNTKEEALSQLSRADQLHLEKTLVTIAYNTGVSGLTEPLEYTLSGYSKSKPVTDVNQFIRNVASNLHWRKVVRKSGKRKIVAWRRLPGGDRKDEVRQYLSNIERRYRSVISTAKKLQAEQYPNDFPLNTCRMK